MFSKNQANFYTHTHGGAVPLFTNDDYLHRPGLKRLPVAQHTVPLYTGPMVIHFFINFFIICSYFWI